MANKSWETYLGIVAIVAVAAAAITALFFINSPKTERLKKIDAARLEDLGQISNQVSSYWVNNKSFPNALADLITLDSQTLNDPITSEPYQYSVTGESTYQLCANFELDTIAEPELQEHFRYFYEPNDKWLHKSGKYCFTFDAKKAQEQKDAIEKMPYTVPETPVANN